MNKINMKDKKHQKDAIERIAYLIAFALMAFMAVITFLILENIGTKYRFAIGSIYFIFIPLLQQRIAISWESKRGIPARDVIIPNKSMKQMILNITLVSMGIYLGLPGIIGYIYYEGIYAYALVITILSMIFGIFIPTIMYFVGERIGRSLGNISKAIIVSLIIAIIPPLLIWLPIWLKLKLSIEYFNSIIFLAQRETYFGTMLIVFFLMHFIPLVIGSYRGSHYKNYFDLAFYANSLDDKKKSEIQDFIVYAEREYLNLQRNEPNKI